MTVKLGTIASWCVSEHDSALISETPVSCLGVLKSRALTLEIFY